MKNTIENYLFELKQELKGSDKAIVQDALADAHEHLTTALNDALEANPELEENKTLAEIIEHYGTPAETAAAYKEIETRTAYNFPTKTKAEEPKEALAAFFGVYTDPLAWGGLVYMLISLLLGLVYFDWAVIALSITLPMMVLLSLFSLSIATLYLLSIDGLALMEGRIIEALLHIRMPRRGLLHPKDLPWKERIKHQVSDLKTWKRLAYMILSLPLGIVYFTVIVTLVAFSVSGFILPIAQEIYNYPLLTIGSQSYFLDQGYYPLTILLGFLLMTVTLHIAKWIGSLQGKFAKYMLVE